MSAKQEYSRHQRVAVLLQRELAAMIQRMLPVSTFGLVTLSTVQVSADLRHAKIYVTSLQAKCDEAELMQALNQKTGLLRSQLAKILELRYLPDLHFFYDQSLVQAQQVAALINELPNS